MLIRFILFLAAIAVCAAFCFFNWAAIMAPVDINLYWTQVPKAPLGLIMLAGLGAMWFFTLAWAATQIAAGYTECCRLAKLAGEARALADDAENSRITDLEQKLTVMVSDLEQKVSAGVKQECGAQLGEMGKQREEMSKQREEVVQISAQIAALTKAVNLINVEKGEAEVEVPEPVAAEPAPAVEEKPAEPEAKPEEQPKKGLFGSLFG